jgi:hypothetical protein
VSAKYVCYFTLDVCFLKPNHTWSVYACIAWHTACLAHMQPHTLHCSCKHWCQRGPCFSEQCSAVVCAASEQLRQVLCLPNLQQLPRQRICKLPCSEHCHTEALLFNYSVVMEGMTCLLDC